MDSVNERIELKRILQKRLASKGSRELKCREPVLSFSFMEIRFVCRGRERRKGNFVFRQFTPVQENIISDVRNSN